MARIGNTSKDTKGLPTVLALDMPSCAKIGDVWTGLRSGVLQQRNEPSGQSTELTMPNILPQTTAA